jgi:NAD+ kinase
MSGRSTTVLTHRRPSDTIGALRELIDAAARAGVTVRLDEEETRKHPGLVPGPGVQLNAPLERDVELCIVLGGDGTILKALRLYARTGVPVFSVNFGQIGFLATVEPAELHEGIARALGGDFELLRLPGIVLDMPSGALTASNERATNAPASDALAPNALASNNPATNAPAAINDVAIHRKVGERVAEIAYALQGEIVGSVRCDGLVIATPAGSTGYNLANGGPVMAWGVEGFIVSFIAPHSLSARALVAAPGDRLTIHNRSRGPLDIAVDGRPIGEIPPGEAIDASFVDALGTIAQLPGSSFYRRLREKFGRLSA